MRTDSSKSLDTNLHDLLNLALWRHRGEKGTHLVRSFWVRDITGYANHFAVGVSHLYLLLQRQEFRFGFVVS